MKLKIGVAVVAGLLLAFGWTFAKRPLAVPVGPPKLLPTAPSVAGVSLSVLPGATMKSQHGFSVRGGSLTQAYRSGLVTFLVEHPKGRLLIDAGVGRPIEAHLKTIPALMQALSDLTLITPTVDLLARHGIAPEDLAGIVLTHAHWDHVSALSELFEVPVWITPEELAFVRSGDGAGALFRQLEDEQDLMLNELQMTGGAYGPFAQSYDFFDDGVVVVVPLAGHTPGQVGVFVNLPSGRRFVFIGDTAWTKEGVDWPAEKPWVARRMVDVDTAAVREKLVLLHQLQAQHPELVVVPAHDARVHETIAALPARER